MMMGRTVEMTTPDLLLADHTSLLGPTTRGTYREDSRRSKPTRLPLRRILEWAPSKGVYLADVYVKEANGEGRAPGRHLPLWMAEEKQQHHHHFFHHHKEEEQQLAEEAVYSETAYSSGGDPYASGFTETVVVAESASDDYEKHKEEEKHHKHQEHLGKMGAVAAGAFALVALFDLQYEKHEANKDTEHAHRHKIEEEIAAAVAVGSGGYAFHEHHEKKEAKEEAEEASGKHHHHLF
ncbi:hypothetical protein GW17_00055016 [Ensete ventricosum]|nr:hypothetical protein GW17_00055016 [Ensete ventricosum]